MILMYIGFIMNLCLGGLGDHTLCIYLFIYLLIYSNSITQMVKTKQKQIIKSYMT